MRSGQILTKEEGILYRSNRASKGKPLEARPLLPCSGQRKEQFGWNRRWVGVWGGQPGLSIHGDLWVRLARWLFCQARLWPLVPLPAQPVVLDRQRLAQCGLVAKQAGA